ncbi:hypothetical protein [Burkholderia seminalis]|uniref:hypothetical protein n=1 Tax=Burkholderia seminalis TaxID=488731 RepID=UPI0019075D36|nr:hypothetical protein [Burkholderia seminalis]MBJ9964469.1 hypothetical protein [Burkholderia seminalis]
MSEITSDARELLLAAGAECMAPDQYEAFEALLETQSDLAARFVNCITKRLPVVADALMALELIAADADAGNSRLTSGVRLALDAILIKAGRKAAPEPVRHITVAGGAR